MKKKYFDIQPLGTKSTSFISNFKHEIGNYMLINTLIRHICVNLITQKNLALLVYKGQISWILVPNEMYIKTYNVMTSFII